MDASINLNPDNNIEGFLITAWTTDWSPFTHGNEGGWVFSVLQAQLTMAMLKFMCNQKLPTVTQQIVKKKIQK